MAYPQCIGTNPLRQRALPTPLSTLHHRDLATATTLPIPRRYADAVHKLPPAPTCSSGATTELNAMIDAHIAWQQGVIARPASRGTLLVDWDGSGEPMVSYRRVEDEVLDCEEKQAQEANTSNEIALETSREEEEEEEEDQLITTLVPSPLRSIASISLPSSPTMHRGFVSMPSSPLRTTSFFPVPTSPAATEPAFKMSFGRALNMSKALPRLPWQKEVPLSVADVGSTEWNEGSFYDPMCTYTWCSGIDLEWHAERCGDEKCASLEEVVEEDERYAMHSGYDAVDVEEWTERATEKRRERNHRKKGKRREKLLGALDKEWCGAKRVLKKMF